VARDGCLAERRADDRFAVPVLLVDCSVAAQAGYSEQVAAPDDCSAAVDSALADCFQLAGCSEQVAPPDGCSAEARDDHSAPEVQPDDSPEQADLVVADSAVDDLAANSQEASRQDGWPVGSPEQVTALKVATAQLHSRVQLAQVETSLPVAVEQRAGQDAALTPVASTQTKVVAAGAPFSQIPADWQSPPVAPLRAAQCLHVGPTQPAVPERQPLWSSRERSQTVPDLPEPQPWKPAVRWQMLAVAPP
jgi:hypothetical protein